MLCVCVCLDLSTISTLVCVVRTPRAERRVKSIRSIVAGNLPGNFTPSTPTETLGKTRETDELPDLMLDEGDEESTHTHIQHA